MADIDIAATQRDMSTGVRAELVAGGFDGPEEVGHGGFGVVYRCREPELERMVAVKLLLSEVHGDERGRFVREQRALGRLSGHPHIVQVLRIDLTATGRPFIVMPYFTRGSLDRVVRATGPLRWPDALSIGVRMAGALAAAHAVGIVHGDVKPGNILLTDYGEPLLSDFGIARFGDETMSASALVQGTPAYTAPEVLRGAVQNAVADVYGLGATLYYLTTGHCPAARPGGEAGDLGADLEAYGVPDEARDAIVAALSADPEDRPGSAIEFGELLREAQRDTGQPVDTMAMPVDGAESARTVLPAQPIAPVTPPPPPIAATKFRPPAPARAVVERTRLLDILRAAAERRLILVHGPAGFGKTTLVVQWARELRATGVPVAWLTVDADDDNVVWFLTHLIEAIRRVRPELARELGDLLEERSSNATRSVLSALIDEIHDSGQPIVLVIDDWHRINGRKTFAAVDYLLEHGCHHLKLVVAGRARTGLPLSKLRVADELVEIDTAALRFDPEETGTFLVGVSGLPLTGEDVTRILESTEGWPAGLRLAQLSLSGRDDPSGFIDNLSGRHHAIGDYLTENVLDSLDPPLLDFLMATTITPRICAGLAAALSGRADARALLEQIADRNLFLHRMEENESGEWFRYHGLFADHLQRRLGYWDPDRVQVLHARAAAWFADHDLLIEAVDHTLAAGDPEGAVDLVESQAMGLIVNSRMATILGLLAKLPASLTDVRPRLQLCAAWANVGLERGVRVYTAARKVESAIEASGTPEPQATAFRVEAALAIGMEEYIADRLENLSELVPEHITALDNTIVAMNAADLAAVDALNRFDFDGVRHWHGQALYYGRELPSLAVMHSHCVAGLSEVEQVHPSAAEAHFTTAIAAVNPESEVVVRATELAGAFLGDLRYRQNRLTEAGERLATALGRHGDPRSAEVALAGYGTGARIAVIHGDIEHAERLLRTGERLAQDRSLPRLAARMINERLRIGLPVPDDVRARLLNLPPYRAQHIRIRAALAELAQESAIRMLLTDGTPAALAAARERAEVMYREILTLNRPRAKVDSSLLYACCLWATGEHEAACAIARPAVTLCVERGVPRLAQDAGPYMSEISAAVGPECLPHLGE
ncbi:serine/threonine-protein kinase [Nocardia aurantia]|uniref:Serine/threonine-protein kinase PknK n=1 Tax=Nocardia aurantia TaxID=2585199 RepID=A0A7K0DPW0_9NOCA|nr:serine/threonine-protein kinase [Nocardia aurantia]MQY27806.1 Serine/threonine-protein kinase PknK [Nocardia aurantia]